MNRLFAYFANLKPGKIVLWCYLWWYLVIVWFHFDPNPKLWINALGISLVIGIALLLSVGNSGRRDPWQTFRLFMMPFCVSSFSALIKGQGFWIVVPPNEHETLSALAVCGLFLLLISLLKWSGVRHAAPDMNKE